MREIFVIKADCKCWIASNSTYEAIYTTEDLNYAQMFSTYKGAENYLPFVIENSTWEEWFNIEKYYTK